MDGKLLILVIIIVVLGAIATPFMYARVSPGSLMPPRLELPPGGEKRCVESTEYMRKNHMSLLLTWRQLAVREGDREYVASDGKHYDMRLTGTCLRCHSNKAEFCDRCHDYVPVKPRCWDCHVIPEKRSAAR